MTLREQVLVVPPSLLIPRNKNDKLICTVIGQPGAQVTWQRDTIDISASGIYSVSPGPSSVGDVNSTSTTSELTITATGSSLSALHTNCSMGDPSLGLVMCSALYRCKATYQGVSGDEKNSDPVVVAITGLNGKRLIYQYLPNIKSGSFEE